MNFDGRWWPESTISAAAGESSNVETRPVFGALEGPEQGVNTIRECLFLEMSWPNK